MSRTSFLLIFLCTLFHSSVGQEMTIDRVEPPHWYTGLHEGSFQLLLYGQNLGNAQIRCSDPDVQISSTTQLPNPNYLVANIFSVEGAAKVTFTVSNDQDEITFDYEFKSRNAPDDSTYLNPSDLIYLIMPDRFANGDTSNDQIDGMTEQRLNRNEMYHRHGGDLQGVIDHLDYLDELGVTTLWLNPVLENDQPKESYHGYAQTDLYNVDRRLGTNELYVDLVNESHGKGMKVIKDVVYNHWGSEHWIFKDIPDSSWFHWWDDFQRTSYRATTLLDPHASERDKAIMANGWFDYHMPDLDQTNPILANYLIQNSLWWIEYANLDGFRIDTYAYSDQYFMAELARVIEYEYPGFPLFGETWVHGPYIQSWFTQGNQGDKEFDSNLRAVTDFQSYYAINDALTKEFNWTEGTARLYYTMASDGRYKHPDQNVVFLDNHDLSRFMSMCGEDLDKFKCGLGWLMTVRGIPMLYYGTEIGMKNFSDPDGKVREDFPGGWADDSANLFETRADLAEEIWNYTSHLANWRKSQTWLGKSKLTQFVPRRGEYVFARHDETHAVLVVMNPTNNELAFEPERYIEITRAESLGKEIIKGESVDLGEIKILQPNSIQIIELR